MRVPCRTGLIAVGHFTVVECNSLCCGAKRGRPVALFSATKLLTLNLLEVGCYSVRDAKRDNTRVKRAAQKIERRVVAYLICALALAQIAEKCIRFFILSRRFFILSSFLFISRVSFDEYQNCVKIHEILGHFKRVSFFFLWLAVMYGSLNNSSLAN